MLRVRLLLGAMALGYGMIFVLCAWLVIYMRHHRSGALRGDTRAARRVLLPAFQPLLWLLTAVSLLYTGCFTLLLIFGPGLGDSRVKTETYYSGRLFVIALPVLYLQQRAVTARALVRAALLSLLLALYNIPIVWLVDKAVDMKTAHYVTMATGALPLLVFGWVCLRPSERASQKTLKEYAVFVGVYYVLRLTYSELIFLGSSFRDAAFTVTLASVFWGSLVPVVIWRVLKADTAHWRGLGRRAVHLQSLFRQKYHYLHERVSSRGLHVLIEMHRKQIIDFAYLALQRKIGAGASAVVFRGILHSRIPVAVKVYTPRILSEEVVAEFSHEAALCGALHHPNVVRFYGMCVCPPTVCLVSELCRASLEDVTRASARLRLVHHESQEEESEQEITPVNRVQQRQQLLVDLNYMIDATRAVVYMHSFTPAFLHRDLKPSNFLVDDYGTCKLTDFGESRSVPTTQKGGKLNRVAEDCSTTAATAATSGTVFFGESYLGVQTPTTSAQFVPPPVSLRPSMRDRGHSAMTVRGTADYMAPELIEGKAGTAVYGEAADVYSLAITLWDIANPLVPKYPEATRSHLQVFDSVLNGERPPLSSSLHPELRRLFTDAWHQQPERRPSATYILRALETLQQEVSAQTALGLATALERSEGQPMVNGQVLMQRMLELGFVDSASEAYRVGNTLMSAGFLHHALHLESFRKTSEMFYFDSGVLGLYAPATPESSFLPSPTSPTSEEEPLFVKSSRHGKCGKKQRRRATDSPVATRCFSPPSEKRRSSTTACHRASLEMPTCACRKLGRGFSNKERHKRRFRRNKKWFAIMEESISTGKLLSHDVESQPSLAETDEFEEYGVSGNWEDMESGGTTGMNASDVQSVDEDLELDLDEPGSSVNVTFDNDYGSMRSSVVII
ncbi:putative serine/threonine-protein kinase/receptor [Phytophthora citrophthora]|uniref:Serine/threonine-protein kinase/receptor n=1 Tax=Phytophthora citrophthora TaxID=4793 RepID=A0AAD9G618_9STRA|nr:putative serine/threonine-protein kinase/receptor [Phytophthora citrophthora]